MEIIYEHGRYREAMAGTNIDFDLFDLVNKGSSTIDITKTIHTLANPLCRAYKVTATLYDTLEEKDARRLRIKIYYLGTI